MYNYNDFLNEYLIIEYSPNHQGIYCLISKVKDDYLYVIASQEFEKSGLLTNDSIACKIDRDQTEYFFEARIVKMEKCMEGLILIILPVSDVVEFYNLRTEKRVNFKFIALINDDMLASVKNISNSGILVSTTAQYNMGDSIDLKLVLSYPHIECAITGKVVRIISGNKNRKDYGIKIIKFGSPQQAEKYNEFVSDVSQKLLP